LRSAGTSPPSAVPLELGIVFALGAALMSFIYIDARGVPADQVGVSGFDAFYHVKMAAMLPQVGLVGEFPWLRFVYFSQVDDGFISHHYGFHVFLAPFVHLGHWLVGDYLAGGRWAISLVFGLNLLLFDLLLIRAGIRWRWVWLIAFLFLPGDFFLRHSYVRAISPSMTFLLLITYFMFRERWVAAGVSVAAYVHLYLGSIVYTPVLVGAFVLASVIAPKSEREIPWRLVLWTGFGWLVGLRTYPYFDGALEFLRMQVLGTGLNPDIAVGSEWNAYGNVWQFAVSLCGPLLAAWGLAVVLRLGFGPRLDRKGLFLVLMHFAFLLLTFKARRFIEYWPVFCLLSAAYLAAPVLHSLAERLDLGGTAGDGSRRSLTRLLIAGGVCGAALVGAHVAARPSIDNFLVEWPVWIALASAVVVLPLVGIWSWSGDGIAGLRSLAYTIAPLAFALVFAAAVILLGMGEFDVPAGRASQLSPYWWGWLIAAAGFVLLFQVSAARCGRRAVTSTWTRIVQSTTVLTTGVALAAVVVLSAAPRLVAHQRNVYCGYNLPAIRGAMDYLRTISQPGDVVFTDDWDVFPVYFYHNSYNHYIVGLDPKFTHSRDPELWERYISITRGLTPRSYAAQWTGPDGEPVRREIRVDLSDIRTYFGARFVVTDGDHRRLTQQLAEATGFAELVYPKLVYDECKDAPYFIFRIHPRGAPPDAAPPVENARFLSDLTPVAVSQGWGELQADRSVSGEPIHLGSRFHLRGLGTHTPLLLTYELPDGYETFEAIVGLNRSTGNQGSFVAVVEVDDREVFRSPVLTTVSGPLPIAVSISGARRLTLRALPTEDGNRWDHVDWADARLRR
jgi:hypothetical protein